MVPALWVAIVGALIFAFAGYQMLTLQSVSGDSVAEAFYNDMGWFSFAMGALTLVVGLPRSSELGALVNRPEVHLGLCEGTAAGRVVVSTGS